MLYERNRKLFKRIQLDNNSNESQVHEWKHISHPRHYTTTKPCADPLSKLVLVDYTQGRNNLRKISTDKYTDYQAVAFISSLIITPMAILVADSNHTQIRKHSNDF